MSARAGIRMRLVSPRVSTERGAWARRGSCTAGRVAAAGSARAARRAGIMPASTASSTAAGTASAARAGEACTTTACYSGSASRLPPAPAARPTLASSIRMTLNRRAADQPRQDRIPSSVRLTAASTGSGSPRTDLNPTQPNLRPGDRPASGTGAPERPWPHRHTLTAQSPTTEAAASNSWSAGDA